MKFSHQRRSGQYRFLVALAGLFVLWGVGVLGVLLDFVEGGFDEFGDQFVAA